MELGWSFLSNVRRAVGKTHYCMEPSQHPERRRRVRPKRNNELDIYDEDRLQKALHIGIILF